MARSEKFSLKMAAERKILTKKDHKMIKFIQKRPQKILGFLGNLG